jgi:hypothetical protein
MAASDNSSLVVAGQVKATLGSFGIDGQLNTEPSCFSLVSFESRDKRSWLYSWFRSREAEVSPLTQPFLLKSLYGIRGSYRNFMFGVGVQPDFSIHSVFGCETKPVSGSMHLAFENTRTTVKMIVLTGSYAFCKVRFDISLLQLNNFEIGTIYQFGRGCCFGSLDLFTFLAKSEALYRLSDTWDFGIRWQMDLKNGEMKGEIVTSLNNSSRLMGKIGINRPLEFVMEFSPRKWVDVGLRSITPHGGIMGKPSLGWFLNFHTELKK